MPPEVDPNLDTGTDVGGGAPPPLPSERESPQREAPQRDDGPGSGRSKIRQQLEQAAEEQRKAQIPTRDRGRDRDTGRYTSRARQEGETPEQREPGDIEAGEQPGAGEGEGAPETSPPEAWTREAKEQWADVPAAVQQAVLKREQDTAIGVRALQDRYREIDAAIGPRMPAFQQNGYSPGQAINQLFLWWEALDADAKRIRQGIPPQAFPALAQSFGLDPRVVGYGYVQQPQQQQGQEGQQGQEAPPEVPPHLQQWFNNQMGQFANVLTQKFGSIDQAMQAQGLSKAVEVMEIWAKDKPYFQETRQAMAQLLQNGMVPPLPNGNADLDKAYDMALYALPEVRARVLADQQKTADAQRKAKEAAERKAQQEQADKARRAAVALGPSAPGAPAQAERKKGKSVRESLQEAIAEHAGERR